jgi:NADPH-dependent glutamate synthase beta subunit-like oxidoreductase
MMRVGIPEYRLPRDILSSEIEEITRAGVEIKTNHQVNSVEELFQQGYHAIFLALGAHQGMRMGVTGEDSPGVLECVSFLRQINLGNKVELGSKVAVVGGGNAAIDAARTALRLRAREVTILYRRTQAEMPASEEEVREALHEGVDIQFLVAPSQVTRDNGRLRLECRRMELGRVDASGRRRPEPVPGSEFILEFDTVIAAVGQMPDAARFGLPTGRGNTLQVDPDTLATPREGVFAGGDVVTGPASVIEAIAQGRQAAISIDRYLGGEGDIEEKLAPPDDLTSLPGIEEGEKYRPDMPLLLREERLRGFAEVEKGYSADVAREEAGRCLRCDLEERE